MKLVYGNCYVHKQYVRFLPEEIRSVFDEALFLVPKDLRWNIVMINRKRRTVKFLYYVDFDADPHPRLKHSFKVDLAKNVKSLYVEEGKNPPIIHRKENLVQPDYPYYEMFRRLTKEEEDAGLFEKHLLTRIGRQRFWSKLLDDKRITISEHRVIHRENPVKAIGACHIPLFSSSNIKDDLIGSSSTAISRTYPSFPTRLALSRSLVHGNVFDWGCGKGRDLLFLRDHGFNAEGWDPQYKRETPPESFARGSFHWVQCIYVLNVIPEKEERLKTLRRIFDFLPPSGHLYVAVRQAREVNKVAFERKWQRYKDGWTTNKKTFQKGFTVEELFWLLGQSHFIDLRILSSNPVIILATKKDSVSS